MSSTQILKCTRRFLYKLDYNPGDCVYGEPLYSIEDRSGSTSDALGLSESSTRRSSVAN